MTVDQLKITSTDFKVSSQKWLVSSTPLSQKLGGSLSLPQANSHLVCIWRWVGVVRGTKLWAAVADVSVNHVFRGAKTEVVFCSRSNPDGQDSDGDSDMDRRPKRSFDRRSRSSYTSVFFLRYSFPARNIPGWQEVGCVRPLFEKQFIAFLEIEDSRFCSPDRWSWNSKLRLAPMHTSSLRVSRLRALIRVAFWVHVHDASAFYWCSLFSQDRNFFISNGVESRDFVLFEMKSSLLCWCIKFPHFVVWGNLDPSAHTHTHIRT